MKSLWVEEEASRALSGIRGPDEEAVALLVYAARLLGQEPSLAAHGGGNVSVKASFVTLLGERLPAILVKASGADLATAGPRDYVPLDLDRLRAMRARETLDDGTMARAFRLLALEPEGPNPSVETLAHAFLPPKYIVHTHAEAILALSNREEGEEAVREALGEDVLVVASAPPGLSLAKTSVEAFESRPDARALVWLLHGLVTWGGTAREAYESTLEMVSRAEVWLNRRTTRLVVTAGGPAVDVARSRLTNIAPALRGMLARPTGDPDLPWRRVLLAPDTSSATLDLLETPRAEEIFSTPPLTSDHVVRTRARPLFVSKLPWDDAVACRMRLEETLSIWTREYGAFVRRCGGEEIQGTDTNDLRPRVVLIPGLGVLGAGDDASTAEAARDLAARALRVKVRIVASSEYRTLTDQELYDVEFRAYQRAKIEPRTSGRFAGRVALITGAAGAIGAGIARGLLVAGAHAIVSDLPGARLATLVSELSGEFPGRVTGIGFDVSDEEGVARAFEEASARWGGVDLLVVNAGIAHVSTLAEMDADAFRRLERVNTEGTLFLLREMARHVRAQRTGGDVVLVSTKNVFAPGAGFAAYSATKAAAHQLARIASVEMSSDDIRVNMVAPDAVFGEGARRSGLWREVGPERMKARGLDERGLEEYYRNRSLLRTRITAEHVARAVIFLAGRETPTTGATIPVDGGLPDATPR